MKIVLDECLPRRLARLLAGHDVRTPGQMNWLGLSNGRLLAAAADFDLLLTVDKNLVNQQHLTGRHLAVIDSCARSSKIEDLAPLLPRVIALLADLQPGTVTVLS